MAKFRTVQFAVEMIEVSKEGVEELAAEDTEVYATAYHAGFIAGLESALNSIRRYGPPEPDMED